MVQNFHMPPTGYGPGSQSDPNEAELEFMEMPQDMRTYTSHVPPVGEDEPGLDDAMALLRRVAASAERVAARGGTEEIDLKGLSTDARRIVAETLGEGEVAMKIRGLPALSVQESVFAGVWGVTGAGLDRVEIGAVPAVSRARAFEPYRPAQNTAQQPGVVNAPALIAELHEKSAENGPLHVINLTLLPHTEADLAWLEERLGQGSTDILSRGYGNCRVRATALPRVWRVQFFNSMDTLILDTFEITDMPEVALAAPEDISDSGARLLEVIGAMQ